MRYFTLLLTILSAHAETFDIAAFTPPPGWKAEQKSGSIGYTHIDSATRTYCVLGIYASTPVSGFAKEWDALVRRGFPAAALPPATAGRTPSGIDFMEGGALAFQGSQRSWAHLMVFAAGDRSLSVLLLATDEAAMRARQTPIEGFVRSLRLSTAAPLPRTRTTGQRLSYQVPAGWSRSESNGTVTLARVVELGFGVKQDFRLVIMPQERTSGAAISTYNAMWSRYTGAIFAAPAPPLPLRVRLAGGATLFYDGGNMHLRQNNAEIDGYFYTISDGEAVVPVLGFFNGWDEALDRALRQFFDSVRLPGGNGRQSPLFEPREIAGVWRSSSTTLANWVDSAGNYRGDASVATGETLTLRADGTYESQFAAIRGANRIRQHDVGRFTVADDMLVLAPNDGSRKQSRYRITGVGKSSDGRGSFLLLGTTRDDFPALSAGSRRPRAGDLYVSVR